LIFDFDINTNNIGNDGTKAIAGGLKWNSTLEEIGHVITRFA
jgi:hypothetical protein